MRSLASQLPGLLHSASPHSEKPHHQHVGLLIHLRGGYAVFVRGQTRSKSGFIDVIAFII